MNEDGSVGLPILTCTNQHEKACSKRYLNARRRYKNELGRVKDVVRKIREDKAEAHKEKLDRMEVNRVALKRLLNVKNKPRRKSYAGAASVIGTLSEYVETPQMFPSLESPMSGLKSLASSQIDFTERSLSCGDVFMLCETLKMHPEVHTLDLSRNNLASQHTCKFIIQLLEANPRITDVHLNSTSMPSYWQDLVQAQLSKNTSIQHQHQAELDRRNMHSLYNTWRDERLQDRIGLLSDERIERHKLYSDRDKVWKALKTAYRAETRKLVRHLRRMEIKKIREENINTLTKEELEARDCLYREWLCECLKLLYDVAVEWRWDVEQEYNAVRSQLRKLYLQNWRDAKSVETARISRETAEQTAVEQEALDSRANLAREKLIEEIEILTWYREKRAWIIARQEAMVDMLLQESTLREAMSYEARDEIKFLHDRRRNIEKQRDIALMQQRRQVCTEEESLRLRLEREQDQLCQILTEITLPFINYGWLKHEFYMLTSQRGKHLSSCPIVTFDLKQKVVSQYMSGQGGAWVSLASEAHLTVAMEEHWSQQYGEIQVACRAGLTKMTQHATQQRAVFEKHRSQLALYDEKEYLLNIMKTIETYMTPTDKNLPELISWLESDKAATKKIKLWGARVRFTLQYESGRSGSQLFLPGMEELGKETVDVVFNTNGTLETKEVVDKITALEYSNTEITNTPYRVGILVQVEVDMADTGFHIYTTDKFLQKNGTPAPDKLRTMVFDGVLDVVVVPPYIRLAPQRLKPWKEGNDKGLQLVEDANVNDPPIIARRSDKKVVVSDGTGLGITHFGKGRLVAEFTVGHTEYDHLYFRANSSRMPVLIYNEGTHSIMLGGTCVANIVSGYLLPKIVSGDGMKKSDGVVVIQFTDVAVSSDTVKRIVERLRFHNVTNDPNPGAREVRFTLEDGNGFSASIMTSFEVEALDDPAELTLKQKNLVFHAAHGYVPDDLKKYIEPMKLPLFKDASLEDPDTEFFVGGHLRVVLASYQKGDSLQFDPSVFEGGPLTITMHAPHEVFFEGVFLGDVEVSVIDESEFRKKNKMVGLVQKATLRQPTAIQRLASSLLLTQTDRSEPGSRSGSVASKDFGTLTDGRSFKEIVLRFTKGGQATIEAVCAFLRVLMFYNPLPAVSTATTRTIDLSLRIGPTVYTHEGADNIDTLAGAPDAAMPEIKESLTLKVTPSLISVNAKFSVLTYTQSSGPHRLTSFELLHDQYIDSYDGGFIKAEFADGYYKHEDILNIREADSIGITLKDWVFSEKDSLKEVMTATQSSARERGLTHLVSQVKQTNKDPQKNMLDVLRKGAKEMKGGTGKKKTNLGKYPSARTAEVDDMLSMSELSIEGKFIGYLYIGSGRLALHFGRNVAVKKKEITTLLRNITYMNSKADPSSGEKVARVKLNDGSWSVSQALIDITIQRKDEVAVITFKDRLRYRFCVDDFILPFCIAPLHTSSLRDEDTSLFTDGGCLSIELQAGGGKGDTLSLLTREQQLIQIDRQEQVDVEDLPYYQENVTDHVFTLQEKSIILDSGVVCTYVLPKSSQGTNDLKIYFSKDPPFLPIDALNYLLSCVTFTNQTEKYKEGVRTFLVRVTDAHNTQDAKERLNLDVRSPLLSLPGNHASLLEKGNTFPLSKIIVNTGEATFMQGYLSVTLISPTQADKVILQLKDSGFRTENSGSSLLCGPTIIGNLTVQPHSIRVSFHQTSKTKQTNIQALLKCVQVRLASPDLLKLEVSLSDEDLSPRVSTVTLTT